MSNVFSFTRRRNAKASSGQTPETQSVSTEQKIQAPSEPGLSFAEVAKRNAENQERLKRERAKANKNVLRSYRIK